MLAPMRHPDVIARARLDFLSRNVVPDESTVRPEILASWRRSASHGLRSDTVRLARIGDETADSQLARASEAVIASRLPSIEGLHCGLTLTNEVGTLLRRWVGDSKFGQRLDRRCVIPGYSTSESVIGTNASGCALETGRPALVAGPEHFADDALHMTSTAAPIRHPLTHRLMGTLSLSLDFSDTNAILLRWVEDLAGLIEQQLQNTLARSEKLLFEAYLSAITDSRHPVLALNEKTVIGNAVALRAIGTTSQPILWEIASRSIRDGIDREIMLELDESDRSLSARFTPIHSGGVTVGALVRLRPQRSGSSQPAVAPARREPKVAALAGLVGSSPAWVDFGTQATAACESGRPLLILGEPGTGKTAASQALASSVRPEREVWQLNLDSQQLTRLESLEDDALPGVLVIDALDCVDERDYRRVTALVKRCARSSVLVIATIRITSGTTEASRITTAVRDVIDGWEGEVIEAPDMRSRRQDTRALLEAFCAELGGGNARLIWSAEAMQVLHRVTWPSNVSSVRTLVRTMLQKRNGSWVSLDDLPPGLRATATRRALAGMEQAEAEAILTALREADGNRRQAAAQLGVARSTLYRKMRALGLDLDAANY